MGKAFTYTATILATSVTVVAALGYGIRRLHAREAALRASVADYRSVMDRASAAGQRERQIQKDGAATLSYQLALSRRQTLPARLEKTMQEAGISLVGRDVSDTKVELRFVDTHLKALKLLARIEAEFPELRVRAIVWTGQPEGLVNLTATFDVWPIPSPAGAKNP
ncbi:MAG: hypothetical protein PHE83_18475 [Opitutaceae bacterium]|nr:hypothetical protein [Opitutaceae bacterium]